MYEGEEGARSKTAEDAAQGASCRSGKATESVSIFARAPVCEDMCRYCRNRAWDVASTHDDHICFPCEQRLRQSGPTGRPPLLPVCDSWCHMCSTQRCGPRDAHDLHLCMRCERRPVTDPWANCWMLH